MADRYPVGVLKDELGNPVGLREFPEGDTLPKSILPPLDYTDTGADPAGTAESLTDDLREEVDLKLEEVDLKLEDKVDITDTRLSDPRTPTGAAGGVLSGTYPNPTFAEDMATQAKLDVAINTRTTPAEAANAAPVQTVQGRKGDVVISRSDLDLENVDNTADIDKPVSVAQQAVLDSKVDKIVGKQLSTEDYSTEEKNKLSGVEAGAQVNSVTSVAGKTGDVTLNKADVGLANVDNTSDSNKPVSTPQQAALNLKLDADANAASASKLATPRTISLSGDASGSTSFDGSANATIVVEVADDSHNHVISNVDGLQTALDGKADVSYTNSQLDTKVDKVVGKGLSEEDFTSTEKGKLAELENFDDSAIQAELATKVDKVIGKELSTNDFTDQLRDKLASLEGSHFRGTFPSKAALEADIPTAVAGDYADVDEAGQDAERYIWDSSDSIWVLSTSKATPLTAAQIKQLYESNPDTNPFDDAAEAKLEGIADGATANQTDAYLLSRDNHTGTQPISTVTGLTAELSGKVGTTDPRLSDPRTPTGTAGGVLSGTYPNPTFAVDMATQAELDAVAAAKVDKVAGKQLSDQNYTLAEKDKLSGVEEDATQNSTDSFLLDRSNHTGTQSVSTVSGLSTALDGKVDKAAGMGLSSNDFTDPLRDKLIGLEGTHWRGTFVSLAALQDGVTDPAAGDYADVDTVGDDVVRYIWDATDGIWVVQSGAVAPITASQVKLLYESNPDTNAFTDADEAKLGGIESGATANSTDAHLLNRANHTGTQAISTVSGLGDELGARPTESALVSASPSILIVDQLRASVEAASGGRMTVLYTASGQPSYMHVFPAFNCEDVAPGGELGTGLHPAFIFDGVGASEIFIGAYQASTAQSGGAAVSLPGVDPRVSINFDTARNLCKANGPGWDMMSNLDWAAIALWCMANGYQPRGNTNYGRSHEDRWETGRRQDGGVPGNASGAARTLTGSGPAAWAHDGTPAGIHDLVGSVWEWVSGMKLVNGRVWLAPDNGQTEEAQYIDSGFDMTDANPWSGHPSEGASDLVKQSLLAPASPALSPVGRLYVNAEGERLPRRGGYWGIAGDAGLGALNLYSVRTNVDWGAGFRPRFRAQ